MPLAYDLGKTEVAEFGVGREGEHGIEFVSMPVDVSVQDALVEMASMTWQEMLAFEEIVQFSPAEKYESAKYVVTATFGEYAGILGDLHSAQMIPEDPAALDDADRVVFYFAKFSNRRGERLTAVRRATQFKGILKNRLVQLFTDALKIVVEKTFRLDNDFDLLVDDEQIHILRPSGFEVIADLHDVIQKAVPQNAAKVQEQMAFVDFQTIGAYASLHPRAAKLLAAICTEGEALNISFNRLVQVCNDCGVGVRVDQGTIRVNEGFEMKFLEVLDRRRYRLQLVEDTAENYLAGSRRRV